MIICVIAIIATAAFIFSVDMKRMLLTAKTVTIKIAMMVTVIIIIIKTGIL